VFEEQVKTVVGDALEVVPPNGRHALVDPADDPQTELTQTAGSRIWRVFILKPHRFD
jgi:hypothetical protein